MSLTTEQVLDLVERCKDGYVIVGSEVRQLADLALWALNERERMAEANALAAGRDALCAKWNDERTERAMREQTASAILAALIVAHPSESVSADGRADLARDATWLADRLRAELGKTGGGGK